MTIIEKIRPYAKFAIAGAGAVVAVANAVLASDATVGSIVVAALVAAGVYRVPNAGAPKG